MEAHRSSGCFAGDAGLHGEGRRVETWSRGATGWTHALFSEGQDVPLESIRCTLDVREVFAAAHDD